MPSDDEVYEFDADDRVQHKPSEDALKQLVYLADQQLTLEAEVTKLEEQLKAKQGDLNEVANKQIPKLMKECRISGIDLPNGMKLTLKAEWKAKLYEDPEQRLAQIAWLDSHGLSNIVKRKLALGFSRDDVELMDVVTEVVSKMGQIEVKKTFDVHNGQMVAALKESLKAGVDVPLKTFQMFEVRRAKIARPK